MSEIINRALIKDLRKDLNGLLATVNSLADQLVEFLQNRELEIEALETHCERLTDLENKNVEIADCLVDHKQKIDSILHVLVREEIMTREESNDI